MRLPVLLRRLRPTARHWLRVRGLGRPRSRPRASRGRACPSPRRPTTARGRGPPREPPLTVCASGGGPHCRSRGPCETLLTVCVSDDGAHGRRRSNRAATGLPHRRGRGPPAAGVLGVRAGRVLRRPAVDGRAPTATASCWGLDRRGRPVALRGGGVGAGEVPRGDHVLRGPPLRLAPRGDPLASPGPPCRTSARGRVVSGGSTLTSRFVRLSRKGRPRTLAEKAVEPSSPSASRCRSQAGGPRLYAAYAPFGGNTVGPRRGGLALLRPRRAGSCRGPRPRRSPCCRTPRPRPPGRHRDLLAAKRNRPPRHAARARGDRRDDHRPRKGRAVAAGAGGASHGRPAPRGTAARRLSGRALPGRGREAPGCARPLRKPVQERVSEIVGRHRRASPRTASGTRPPSSSTSRPARCWRTSGNHWPPGPGEHGEHVDVVPRGPQHRQRPEPFL